MLPVWLIRWSKRAAFATAWAALTGIAWIGYGGGDSQMAWAALWSLCTPAR